tara:strand:- start:156 stop:533 length:378 start_codon:yes stop_codon:yes gene_type:complete
MGAGMGNIAFAAGERRRYERLEIPQLYLRIGGCTYLTAEWSFGGFLLEDDHGIMPTGALVRIDGLADERSYKKVSKPIAVDIRARVIRVMPEHRLAALSCLKLDDAAYSIMNEVRAGLTLSQPAE